MYNKVIMVGRIATTPEIRKTNSDVSVTSFRIAVDRSFVPKGGKRKTDFFNVTVWRGSAEFVCKNFSKGDMILVEGEMQTSRFTDKNGNPSLWYEIAAERVSFATNRKHSDPVPCDSDEGNVPEDNDEERR